MRLALLLASAATAVAAGAAPALRFASVSPAVVLGTGFAPREHVRATLTAGDATRVRLVTATGRGTFTVRFGTLSDAERCGTLIRVVAKGSQGHRAARTLPTLECPQR